jgi:transcriptional regulator with PAS, ATPase and Fis domain
MNDLKKLVHDIMNGQTPDIQQEENHYTSSFLAHKDAFANPVNPNVDLKADKLKHDQANFEDVDDVEEYLDAEVYHEVESVQKPLSLEDMERQMIKRTLEKHRGKRKAAAEELKISERTLYRKIKEYGIE